MKHYSFEYSRGKEKRDGVGIHRKNRRENLWLKLLCVLLAFLFWIIVTDIGKEGQKRAEGASTNGDVISAEERDTDFVRSDRLFSDSDLI